MRPWLIPVSVSLAVLAVACCLCLAILDGRALIKAQFGVATREGQATRDLIDKQATAIQAAALAEVRRQGDALRITAAGRIDSVVGESAAWRSTADTRITAIAGVLDSRSGQALSAVEGLREDLRPVLGNMALLEAHADRTVVDLHPQLLGLVAASKVTAGETAQTMRSFRDAVPNFILQGAGIAENVNVATREFSGVAANLNRLTKPRWYDRLLGYGLSAGAMYRDLNPGYNAGQAIRGMFVKQK